MGIIEAIGNGLKAIAAVFGWSRQRDAEKNTAAMQANAAASTEVTIAKEAADADAKAEQGNLDDVRKLAGE